MIQKNKALNLLMALMLCLGLVQIGPAPAMAAEGRVIAGGLNYPRYMAVDDAGNIYVTEPGTGGSETLPLPPGQEGPAGTRGNTGQVSKIAPNGTKTVIARGLPSYNSPDEGAVGPAGIVLSGNSLYISTGASGAGVASLSQLPNEGSILRINISTGQITKVADLIAFEKANNPDPNAIDSDPYGLAMGPDGMLYAADAGGNDLLKVNPNTGQITLVAVMPGLAAPPGFTFPPGGNPNRGGRAELDPVTTGVAVGPDGTIYAGNLSGGPFPKGAARVARVTPDGRVSYAASGLTMVTGVAIGPDKKLYVSELTESVDFSKTPPEIKPGRVSRINADGSTVVVASGLLFPNGIAFDKAGNLYVTTGTAFGPPNVGTVTRYDGVAPAAAPVPLPNTGPVSGQVSFITGYNLGGTFLNFWQANGGLPVFGYPIDSERMSDGVIAQWLERNRFEMHPELQYPYNVLLGRLGAEALQQKGIDWASLPKVSSAPAGCRYFAETSHSLCNDFLKYWTQNGLEFDRQSGKTFAESLALFGLPISEPRVETNSSGDTVLTQWFERARFEFHPNNPAQYRVLLGLVGTEVKFRTGAH